MAGQTVLSEKRRRGPKPTGVGTLVGVRLQPPDLAALDAYAASTDKPMTRPQAIRAALTGWLRMHEFLTRSDDDGAS